jgi:hypothetical protein
MHPIKGTLKLFGPSILVGLIAPLIFPPLRRGLKPAAKGVMKTALALGESIKEGTANAREQFTDLLAEVKAEREQEAQRSASTKDQNA